MCSMRRAFPSKKLIEREIAILNTPPYQEARDTFVAYVERLQAATTAGELSALHRELVFDVNARQKALAEVKQEHKGRAEAEIERLKEIEPKPTKELGAAQAILRGTKHADAVADALQHATRVLVDGIVWRGLDYDRTMISILGKEPPVAQHANDDGFFAELAAVEFASEQTGVLVIHNDTSNCLRRGDITVIAEVDGRRIAIPKEVKAGSGNASKQVARIIQALDMIHTRRFFIPTPFTTHLPDLPGLIAEARRDGYTNRPFDCMFVQVVDLRHWAGREQELEARSAAATRSVGWNPAVVDVGMSTVSRIRDRGDSVVELAPMSIFPLAAEDIADIMLGFIEITVQVNKELLALRFAESGMTARFFTQPDAARHFLEARRGTRGFLMPAIMREQMLHELLTAESVVAISKDLLGTGKTREWMELDKAPLVGFENERQVWSPDARIDLAA